MSVVLTIPQMIFAYVSGGKLLQKIGTRFLMAVTVGLMALYCLLLPLVPNMALFYVMQLIGGAGYGFCISLVMGMSIRHIEPSRRSSALGIFQCLYGVGMTLGPIGVGALADRFTLSVAFYITGIIGIIAVLWSLVIIPNKLD